MIKPTVGRVVWYTPSPIGVDGSGRKIFQFPCTVGQPLAAIIAYVHSDSMVNLTVFDANGESHGVCSVDLIQDGQPKPEFGRYCEWMPYQKGQAAKTGQVEAQLKAVNA